MSTKMESVATREEVAKIETKMESVATREDMLRLKQVTGVVTSGASNATCNSTLCASIAEPCRAG